MTLKSVVADCGLEMPHLFTATRLRKYCGTTSQLLALTEADFEVLTRHMGHDAHVHREYYRLPDTTLELTKAAVLMTTLDEGEVNQLKGKDLGTILELGIGNQAEEDEDVDEDGELRAQDDQEEHQKLACKRRHRRFTKEQNKACSMLIEAREKISMEELKEWMARQGGLFKDRTAGETMAKLYNMKRKKKQRAEQKLCVTSGSCSYGC